MARGHTLNAPLNTYILKEEQTKLGRPRSYTPLTLWEKFKEYKSHTKGCMREIHVVSAGKPIVLPKERPLTEVGFCVFAEIDRHTLRNYSQQDDYFTIYARIKTEIEADQIEGAMLEMYNPSITARVVGLVDKQDITTNEKPIPSTVIAVYGDERIELTSDDI